MTALLTIAAFDAAAVATVGALNFMTLPLRNRMVSVS